MTKKFDYIFVVINGISSYRVHRSVRTISRHINRDGAEEARGAHNSEVSGSNPLSGISIYQVHRLVYTIQDIYHKNQSPVAQRKRAVKHRLQIV